MSAAYETGVLDGRNQGILSAHMMSKASKRYLREYRSGLEEGKRQRREERAAQRAAVVDLVTAHHDAGHPAHDVRRALIDLAADSLEPLIREVIEDVYGTSS